MNTIHLEKYFNLFNNNQAIPNDPRLSATVYHTDYKYQLKEYNSLEEWEIRKKELRKQILISSGLWPLPERHGIQAKIFDKICYDDFSIEKVMFESYPGFHVTGNLYMPIEKKGPFPAILNPHGHWENGRFEYSDLCKIPTRCANFAKMGFIAFAYDMVGCMDSNLISHTFDGIRFEEDLWNFGLFGLQLWNSICCVDFISSLPDVDKMRIGCTGASGGGTQAFFLAAVDDRIKAAVPVNMISSLMQGGCRCENSPNLRIGTNNVEIASTIAPRPMLMVACTGDWTHKTKMVEYPAIQNIYKLYDTEAQVEYFCDDAPHNYNKNTREAVYRWFRKHFLSRDELWREKEVDFGGLGKLRIFPESESLFHACSDKELVQKIGTERFNKINDNREKLFSIIKENRKSHLDELWKTDELKTREDMFSAIKCIFGIDNDPIGTIPDSRKKVIEAESLVIEQLIVEDDDGKVQIPIVSVRKKGMAGNNGTVLLVHPDGKRILYNGGKWKGMIQDLLDRNYTLVSFDAFGKGEFKRPYCNAGRNYSGIKFFTTFNYTDDVFCVQDVVTVYNSLCLKNMGEVELIGLEEAGQWCIAAFPFLKCLKNAIIDMTGFDPFNDASYVEKFFIPGFCSAGGFETCIKLGMPEKLSVFNLENSGFAEILMQLYKEKSMEAGLTILDL